MVEPPRRRRRQVALLLALPAVLVVGALVLGPLLYALEPRIDLIAPPRALDGVAPAPPPAFDRAWLWALAAQATYTALVLALQIPFGVLLALALPRAGWRAGLAVFAVAWPLAVPQSVAELLRVEFWPRACDGLAGGLSSITGTPWQMPAWLGEWSGYVLIDAWRYTPLVALLCAFALRRADDLDLAARVDGLSAWQRFTCVHWPRMRSACALAVVVRAVDSFAAWPHVSSTVSLAAWVRNRAVTGPTATTAVATALTLAVVALVPAWPLRSPSGGRR